MKVLAIMELLRIEMHEREFRRRAKEEGNRFRKI